MTNEERLDFIKAAVERVTGRPMRRQGQGWLGFCPAHGDQNNASLSIGPGNAGVTVKCFAGCDFVQIATALNLPQSDFFYESHSPRSPHGGHSPTLGDNGAKAVPLTVAVLARDKRLLPHLLESLGCREEKQGVIIPYYEADGTEAPRARLRRARTAKQGSRWLGKKEDGDPIPYGLWRLADARAAGYLVIVEGESDTWTLWHHGFPALGIPGASLTSKIQASHLEGIGTLYLLREHGKSGDTFIAGMRDRLEALTYPGEARVVTLGKYDDPNDMHKALEDDFADAFRVRMNAAGSLHAQPDTVLDLDPAVIAELFMVSPAPQAPFAAPSNNPEQRIIHWHDGFYEYDGRCYRQLPNSDLRARLAQFVRGRRWHVGDETRQGVPSTRLIGDVLLNVTAQRPVPNHVAPPVWMDGSPARHLIVLQNGVLDIDTAARLMDSGDGLATALQPHNHELFAVNSLPFPFDPAATMPKFQAFLDRCLPSPILPPEPGEEDRPPTLQEFLQEWTGYCLIPTQARQKILLMFGQGANGKSIYQGVLRNLLGAANISAVPVEMLSKPHALNPLVGKLVNYCSEWGKIEATDINILKQISGGDPVWTNPKFKEGTSTPITARFLISSNNPPSLTDRTKGIWRRLLVMPWNIEIPVEDQKEADLYIDELSEELPGVLLWALQGLARLQARRRFSASPEMVQSKARYELDSNPAEVFCEECLQFTGNPADPKNYDPDAYELTVAIYTRYCDWCKRRNFRPLNEINFGKSIGKWFERECPGVSLSKLRGRKRLEDGTRPYFYPWIYILGTTPPVPLDRQGDLL